MITFLFALIGFFLLIGIIVAIHEFGHYIVAVLCGMKVLEFSIGFGPKLFQKTLGKDKTLFTLRLLPMGGFVKPLDESSCSKEDWDKESEIDKKRAFGASPKWKKFLMVSGGPLANFILAIVIFTGIFFTYGVEGVKPVISQISPNSLLSNTPLKAGDEILSINGKTIYTSDSAYSVLLASILKKTSFDITIKNNDGIQHYKLPVKNLDYEGLLTSQIKFHGVKLQSAMGDVVVSFISADSPAEKAGLKIGDTILYSNNEKITSVINLVEKFHANPGKEFNLVIKRDNETLNLNVTPTPIKKDGQTIGLIGIRSQLANPLNTKFYTFSLKDSLFEAVDNTWEQIQLNMSIIGKLVWGQLSSKSLSGPLSIAEYSGGALQLGTKYFLQITALISIAIGFFNLLPIPMLDGGHLVQYILETIRRKDFSIQQIMFANKIGIACLFGIFTLAISNDIIKYVVTFF